MKGNIFVLVLVILLTVLPLIAFAQIEMPETCKLTRDLTKVSQKIDGTNNCAKDATVSIDDYGMCCLVNTIYSITDWIFYILMALVGIMIVIGAFSIITAAGAPDKVNAGKNYILYAIIGMIVAFFARTIPAMVKTLVSM
jgi:hypothetical protein